LSDHLDLETLEFLGSSHDADYSLNDAQNLVVTFPNILLPDSTINNLESSGFFNFKIKPKADITLGSEIINYSDIFFDFNHPIRTNETLAIIGESCDEPIYQYIEKDICIGDSFEGFDRSGLYTSWKCSESECDTFLIIGLTLQPNSFTSLSTRACEGQTIDQINTNITIRDTLFTEFGCDSIISHRYTFLPIAPWNNQELTIDICDGESFENYTETGIYLDTIQQNTSCYISKLNLTVNDVFNSIIDTSICNGQSFMGFIEPGVYTLSDTTAFGCDSILTINLEVLSDNDPSCLPTNIEDIGMTSNVLVYPNPTQEYFYIQSTDKINKIQIYDISGKIALTRINNSPSNFKVHIHDLISGVYIIKIYYKHNTITKKLVIE